MRAKIVTLLIICLTLTLAFVTFADVKGRLIVIVKDTKGKPIEGVKITLKSTQSENVEFTITTNKKGKAIIAGIDPIVYKVRAEKEGYQYLEGTVKLRAGVKVKQKWTMLSLEEVKEIQRATIEAQMTDEMRAQDAFNKGQEAYQNGDVEKAKEYLLKAIDYDENVTYAAYLLLGQFAFNDKNADEAIKYLEKAKELCIECRHESDILRLLGACYMIKQDYNKAREIWGKFVEIEPDPTVLYNLANIEIHFKKYKDAIKWLEMCREKNPDFADGLSLLGDIYLQLKDYKNGLEVYREYLALLEKSPDTDPQKLKEVKETVKLLEIEVKKQK